MKPIEEILNEASRPEPNFRFIDKFVYLIGSIAEFYNKIKGLL